MEMAGVKPLPISQWLTAREVPASCSRKGHSPALPCREGEHREVDGAGTATPTAGHAKIHKIVPGQQWQLWRDGAKCTQYWHQDVLPSSVSGVFSLGWHAWTYDVLSWKKRVWYAHQKSLEAPPWLLLQVCCYSGSSSLSTLVVLLLSTHLPCIEWVAPFSPAGLTVSERGLYLGAGQNEKTGRSIWI